MELGLSLGDVSKPQQKGKTGIKKRGFCMALGINSQKLDDEISQGDGSDDQTALHLNLLPIRISSHLHSLPWSSDNGSSENGSSGNMGPATANRLPAAEVSSANSVGSMDLGIYLRNMVGNDVVEAERESSRACSDDDENALNHRKKLRLSKQQSASLEESFKENNTLNPKEKVALAKRLNLRARQVEVWFQNRRARTKLKQTEVDCDYLKRCCDTLTEENRRLQKELQELRALKTSSPFCTQLPATTLTMCPSCERVATTSPPPAPVPFSENRQRFFPFCQIPGRLNQSNQSFSNI